LIRRNRVHTEEVTRQRIEATGHITDASGLIDQEIPPATVAKGGPVCRMRAEAMLHACELVMFLQVNATSVLVRTLVLQTRSRWFESSCAHPLGQDDHHSDLRIR
jgi:hypothetical protein